MICNFGFFLFSKTEDMLSKVRQRMAIVEVILLRRVSAIHFCNSKGRKLQRMYGDKKKQ